MPAILLWWEKPYTKVLSKRGATEVPNNELAGAVLVGSRVVGSISREMMRWSGFWWLRSDFTTLSAGNVLTVILGIS